MRPQVGVGGGTPRPRKLRLASKMIMLATISEAITITKSEQNPVLLNSNLSYEIAVSYKTMGSVFQRSVLFVNAPGTQLIFKLSARKSDFDRLYSVFRSSVLTWQWVEAAVADTGHATANEQRAR